jgi:RNA polymerase II subunit A-like phosphatase
MTHSANGPTVSIEEAQRLERETAEHLTKSRKLSLIVDLDQTIVHATVDPTVGEWIADGTIWEAKHAEHVSSAEEAEVNPNWEALKDVKQFTLGTETVPMRGAKVHVQSCIYYIKPRYC